jgi:predicted small secreted protein
MRLRMILMTALLLPVLLAPLCLTGCNTWEGFGKDVERTGEAMQDK